MLTQQEITEYEAKLQADRDRLMKEIQNDSEPANPGGDVADPEEEADEAEDLSNKLAIAQTMRDKVQQIDAALERIRNGAYGVCASCGSEISKSVLDAAPESLLCEECKQKAA